MTVQLRISRPNTLVKLSLLLLIIKNFFGISYLIPYNDQVDNILIMAVGCLIGLHMINKRYSPWILAIYILTLVLAIYTYYVTGIGNLLISILVIVASRDEDINEEIYFIFTYEVILFVMQMIIYFIIILVGDAAAQNSVLGFSHKNVCGIFIFNLIIQWVWIKFEELNFNKIACINAISLLVYFICRSDTFLVEIIMLDILLALNYFKNERIEKIMKGIAEIEIPILAFIIILLVTMYNKGNVFARRVSDLLSTRIKLGAYALEHWGYTALGQAISGEIPIEKKEAKWGLSAFTFDNVYTYLTMNIGIVWIVILSLAFYVLAKRGDIKYAIFMILWGLYGITEVHVLNLFMCFPLILITEVLMTKTD